MDGEKSAMWRVPPELVALVDAMTAEVAADPALRAEVGLRGGQPTRAGILRLLVTRGATSLQGTIRERRKAEAAAQVESTPAKPAPKARKAAKRKKARK